MDEQKKPDCSKQVLASSIHSSILRKDLSGALSWHRTAPAKLRGAGCFVFAKSGASPSNRQLSCCWLILARICTRLQRLDAIGHWVSRPSWPPSTTIDRSIHSHPSHPSFIVPSGLFPLARDSFARDLFGFELAPPGTYRGSACFRASASTPIFAELSDAAALLSVARASSCHFILRCIRFLARSKALVDAGAVSAGWKGGGATSATGNGREGGSESFWHHSWLIDTSFVESEGPQLQRTGQVARRSS